MLVGDLALNDSKVSTDSVLSFHSISGAYWRSGFVFTASATTPFVHDGFFGSLEGLFGQGSLLLSQSAVI